MRDVRLEAQAAELYVDFVFKRMCRHMRLENGLEGNISIFFSFCTFMHFFRKESSIFRIHTQISF